MNIKSTITFLALLSITFILMSNSQGPASVQGADRTGSPLSAGACDNAGCHVTGAFDPTVSVEILTGGEPITGYEPGASYQVRVTITAGTGTPEAYGFQVVALDENNENGGEWDLFPAGGQQLVEFASGVQYTEHSTPSSSNVFTTALWEAPQAGEGDVTFYVGSVSTNGNGNSAGDGVALTSITLSEGFMTSTDDLEESFGFSAFPNPAQETVSLKINSLHSGLANLRISDVAGKLIHSEQLDLIQGENVSQVDISDLNNGLYLIYLSNDSEVVTETIVKI